MGRGYLATVAVLMLAVCEAASATTLAVEVSDQNGRPVANAVVSLVPDSAGPMPDAAKVLAAEKKIDQRDETFIPLVTIVPKGGRIVFANSDQTTHQVYSFSPVKQFEITIGRGETSPPIAFEKPGVAALGCNIHDHMIAYAFVAESPWTSLSGDDGRAVIADVPPGNYRAQVWHPNLPPGRPVAPVPVDLSGDSARLEISLRLLSPPVMSHSHRGSY